MKDTAINAMAIRIEFSMQFYKMGMPAYLQYINITIFNRNFILSASQNLIKVYRNERNEMKLL
jgi:hypothetical protein